MRKRLCAFVVGVPAAAFLLGLTGCDGFLACGGLTGGGCPDGFYCQYETGTCGAADETGFCVTIPEACTLEFAPVCGCDDQTYSNECAAAAAGVSVVHEGECAVEGAPCGGELDVACPSGQFCLFDVGDCGEGIEQGACTILPDACPEIFSPVCGCDGQSYGNSCEAMGAGVSVDHEGECSDEPEFCGGIAGIPCPEGQFCRFDGGTCGAADQGGTCADIPELCTEVIDPVCGCDDTTYRNDCEAFLESVSVLHEGPCEGGPVVCNENAGLNCTEPAFCKFETGVCDSETELGECIAPPEVCIEVIDPVCGCDGVTYDNECRAEQGGVGVGSVGACQAVP